MWLLSDLIKHSQAHQKEINGRYVPVRPLNGTRAYLPLWQRIKDAYAVFMCKAEAFTWPENQ